MAIIVLEQCLLLGNSSKARIFMTNVKKKEGRRQVWRKKNGRRGKENREQEREMEIKCVNALVS